MVLDYSKWDALELSDDSDIEVHPNVDKRSFIRAKQNQIHQERVHRRHQIETLKYERIINDGLLTRIDALLKALQSHHASSEDPDELIFQSLIESAGDPMEDRPPPRPEGVHDKIEEQPTYSKMMAALVDQVKKEVNEKKPDNRYESYIGGVKGHQTKVLDLQQELLVKLAELEREESKKITSDSIHTGFDSSHVSKSKDTTSGTKPTKPTSRVELLNSKRNSLPRGDSYQDSGADADIEDEPPAAEEEEDDDDDEDSNTQPTALGKAFANLPPRDYRASMQYISQNPSVLAERETDGLLVHAFDSQLAGKDAFARQCVHQALLLQYCRSLGRDGVALFFKRITTPEHQARKIFLDDVNTTYTRLRERATEMAKEREANGDGDGDREQIQLHAVNPNQTILIAVPDPSDIEARRIFDAFPPGLQRALESGQLDEVNKVLGKMSVEQAEEVVEQLSEGGMLSMEEGIIDATTEEGRSQMKEIERLGRMPGKDGGEESRETGHVDEVEGMD